MARSRIAGGVAGLLATVLLAVYLLAFGLSQPSESGQAAPQPPSAGREAGRPIPMLTNVVALEISLGLKDQKPTAWDGEVQISTGRITNVAIVRGGPKPTVEGSRFSVRSVLQMMGKQPPLGPIIRVNVDAPPTATVTVKTKQGQFAFTLAEVTSDTPKAHLDGQVTVERQEAVTRLTGPATEDDFPALANGRDGTIWLAYVEYQPGKPLILERVLAGGFDALVPTGHGDRIRLMRFDGQVWQPPLDVTDSGLDVWRPTVAVDGKGGVVVAWSQQVNGDWEIFHRRYAPPSKDGAAGQWSNTVRLTQAPGSDFHVVAATDAAGVVWLAWQGWRKDNFEILLAALGEDHPAKTPKVISNSPANDWSPAIAADSRGNVYVAYDTYDKGNYDVRLYVTGKETKTIPIADSPRFEARPSLACDAQDRLWIAYEAGDEQWGKDYSTDQFDRIGFKNNPGSGLYITRTIKVKCLVDGKLMQPPNPPGAFISRLGRAKSLPRLAVDAAGGLWLLLRHHPLPGGAGEVWDSFAVRYDGKNWSPSRHLPNSANLLDNRPALVAFGQGILAVYSSDNRVRTQNREQDDLFALILNPPGATYPPELVPADPADPAKVTVVHPNEAADVARLRNYRVEVGGKQLRPVRGEFHRHTEYSSHRDQDGSLEDSWRYSLDAGRLDWMGNGDHMNGFNQEYMWWQIQKITDLYHNPPHFIAAQTYERSAVYPNGHRNVIMPRRGIRPLPFGKLEGTAEKGTPDVKTLYQYLKHFGGICASHTSATTMGTDWRDNDPLVEPIVEIYQGHRHNYEHLGAPRSATAATQIGGYEPAGFVWNALEKGYRLGFQSSSDHVSTHMSYAIVLVEEISRSGIIEAFKKRHCYAATDNILLVVRSGEQLMGEAFETARRPTLEIVAHGTAPITKLHVIRDNKYVYSMEPKTAQVQLRYTDMDAPAGKTSYYYVRLEQADGNLAWGSPMWITYKP
jgi:hypothetical protein